MSQAVFKPSEGNFIPENFDGESYQNIFVARFANSKTVHYHFLRKVPAEHFSCYPEELYQTLTTSLIFVIKKFRKYISYGSLL